MSTSSPRERLALVGDLVDLDATPAAYLRVSGCTQPGLVLALDDGWAHVQWYDDDPTTRAGAFGVPCADAWTQWHQRPKLTVISAG